MKQVFVDTSAWDAIADAGDANHEIALLYKDEIAENCRLVVTNYTQRGHKLRFLITTETQRHREYNALYSPCLFYNWGLI